MTAVALSGLGKRFGASSAVTDLSLQIADGEFVVLLGPTGAGKTTTLRLVAGLETPDAGAVWIGGRDVTRLPPAERDVTFVFQQYSLYPHLSVFENLAFPLRSPLRRMPEDAIRRRVGEVAALLRIEDKLQNPATKLSGGQMQRVAIGRALVRRPAIYLMDEPLSSLDAKLRADLRLELKNLQRNLGATMLFVTHDQVEAMTMADRIGVLDRGRLAQLGPPRDIYGDPCNIIVAQRLGQPSINILPVTSAPADRIAPGTTQFGARSEHIRVTRAADGAGARGRIARIEHLGDQSHLHLKLDGHALVTLADPHAPFAVGDPVDVSLVEPFCFGADGGRLRS